MTTTQRIVLAAKIIFPSSILLLPWRFASGLSGVWILLGGISAAAAVTAGWILVFKYIVKIID